MNESYNYKAIIEYDGTKYYGSQIQHDKTTVAKEIYDAIYKFSRETVQLIFAGRTDAGVHARGQVIGFKLSKNYPLYKITDALNFFLRGKNIVIIRVYNVSDDYHVRFNAKERIYEYLILNRRSPAILLKKRCWHVKYKLNIVNMRKAATLLIGRHDFSSFRNSECQSKSPVRTISNIVISKKNNIIKLTFSAPSFLHNQVRIITGTLVEIGSGKLEADDILEILSKKNRKFAGQTAPAYGLYLSKVKY